jgi:hypothetical protein
MRRRFGSRAARHCGRLAALIGVCLVAGCATWEGDPGMTLPSGKYRSPQSAQTTREWENAWFTDEAPPSEVEERPQCTSP